VSHTLSLRPVSRADDAFLFELYASTRSDLAALGLGDVQRHMLLHVQWMAQRHGVPAVLLNQSGQPENLYSGSANTTLAPQSIGVSGGSQPHDNMQPYQCVTSITRFRKR